MAVVAVLMVGQVALPGGAVATRPAGETTGPVAPAADAVFDNRPAHNALVRLVGPARANQVILRQLDEGEGTDRFEIYAKNRRLVVAGTSPAEQLAGFGWYLRYVAHADISINGAQVDDIPLPLPLPAGRIEKNASVDHRFALNDTNQGYAGPYLSWKQWQRRIDVLALHGINEVLVYEGQEAVYQQMLAEFGYTKDDVREWIPQPPHQSWWLLQNMCCVDSPISQQLIDHRVELGRNITDHLRSLGMTPVLPGYFGTVPTDFETRNPGAHTIPQGPWNGLERPDWLDTTDPIFTDVAETYYRVQSELFGDSTMYKMDLLHEGGRAGGVDVGAASVAVQEALEAAHPDALWTILGWEHNPRRETLEAIDRSKMFIVDGLTERAGTTNREADFLDTEYAFGTIYNFGGRTSISASVAAWNEKFHAWRERGGSTMNGIALMPEAIDNNPAAVAFFTELPWQDGPVELPRWWADYATARYGGKDPHAIDAWQTIGRTAYSWPSNQHDGNVGVTSLYLEEPDLAATGKPLQYDPAEFETALADLLDVAPRLRDSTAYRYDLVDVARQVLANESRVLLPQIKAAYASRDSDAFADLTGRWLARMRLMDDLLGTDSSFLFGSWQAEADRQAADPEEAALLDYNLKSLISTWAGRATPNLMDYTRREYNGLVGDYYAHRWELYFDALSAAMNTEAEPERIDWRSVADEWAGAGTRYATEPSGNAYVVATRVAERAGGTLEATIDRKGAYAGETVRVRASFTNTNILRGTGPLAVTLDAPEGLEATASTPTERASVPPGETVTVGWDVTVLPDAKPGTVARLTATASWGDAGEQARRSAGVSLLAGGPVGADYETVTHTDAVFAHRGSQVSIAAGGRELGADTNEFAAVYQEDALVDGAAVATDVSFQEGGAPYSRSGLIVANDLSALGTGGYANVAVTPDHGCVFSYDSDGDGRLDMYPAAAGFRPPVQVRLALDGNRLTASCSTDGENWAVVGTGTVPDAADRLDVGMFVSSVNVNTGEDTIATFDGGIADAPLTTRDSSGDEIVSVGKPATARSFENGSPPSAANDGVRTNAGYWAGPMNLGPTWWRVDLGTIHDVSRVNVRNYVDGRRYYTYRVEGSRNGEDWFTLGGRSGTRPATDAGDTMVIEGKARYVRVTGLGNSANPTFHVTEVTVHGAPAGVSAVSGPVAEPASSPDATAPVTVRTKLFNASDSPVPVQFEVEDLGHWTAATPRVEVEVPAHGFATPAIELIPNGEVGWTTVTATVTGPHGVVASRSLDLVSGGVHVSDLEWAASSNGWGPIERDTSNGGRQPDDGGTLTIEGRTYSKGLGVHANARVALDLAGRCDRFESDFGIDDWQSNASVSSVVFRLIGDGEELWHSGLVRAPDPADRVEVDVTGVQTLEMVVDDGGNGNAQDHADWAGAWVSCRG